MSGIAKKYCLISTSYLTGLVNISYYCIFDRVVCFSDFLAMRTLDDAYHKLFESD